MKLITTPKCPKCEKSLPSILFLYDGGGICCGVCGCHLNPREMSQRFREIAVPTFLEYLFGSLVIHEELAIETVDEEAVVVSSQEALSKPITVKFSHGKLLCSCQISWFEVKEPLKFNPHKMDFGAIARHVPEVSSIVGAFREADFLVSEAPGKKGRALRDCAGIRFCRYGSMEECVDTNAVPKTVFARAFLTWGNMDYRAAGPGSMVKIVPD